MIEVTKLNNQKAVINCDLIEMVESTPDTMITMTTGRRLHVRESVDDIVEKTLDYQHRIIKHRAKAEHKKKEE